VLDPSTVRNRPQVSYKYFRFILIFLNQLSYQPYIHNVRKSTSEIAKEKEKNPNWPHFKMKRTETTKATINVNPVQVERQVENESIRSGESHTRIPSSTITTDSGFADEPSKMKESAQKPVEIVSFLPFFCMGIFFSTLCLTFCILCIPIRATVCLTNCFQSFKLII